MKKIGIILLLVLATNVAYSQETPYLQLTIRDNFLTQKIDFLEGPMVITNTAFGILSGVFKRNARNLAREAVDSYNFGRTDAPVYFEENRVDIPLFSKVIRF
jgi:hypothetical protein